MSSNHLELITFRWMLRCGRSHVWWRRLTQVSVAQQMICWRVKLHQIRNIDVKRIEHPTTHCYQKLLIILRLHPQVDINIPNSVTSKQKKKKADGVQKDVCVNCNTVGENPHCHTTSQPALFSQPSLLPSFTSTNVKCPTLQAKNFSDCMASPGLRPYTGPFIQECHRFGTFRITYKLGQPARIGMLGSEILLVELDEKCYILSLKSHPICSFATNLQMSSCLCLLSGCHVRSTDKQ